MGISNSSVIICNEIAKKSLNKLSAHRDIPNLFIAEHKIPINM